MNLSEVDSQNASSRERDSALVYVKETQRRTKMPLPHALPRPNAKVELNKFAARRLTKRFLFKIDEVIPNTGNLDECDCFSFALCRIANVSSRGYRMVINADFAEIGTTEPMLRCVSEAKPQTEQKHA